MPDDFDEVHYAPISGDCQFKKDGEALKPSGRSEFNELLAKFLADRELGHIVQVGTTDYGHALFHGHRGRVDTYRRISQ